MNSKKRAGYEAGYWFLKNELAVPNCTQCNQIDTNYDEGTNNPEIRGIFRSITYEIVGTMGCCGEEIIALMVQRKHESRNI
jgi:hypothetical protein